MQSQNKVKRLHLLIIGAMLATLTFSMAPVSTVRAQATSTSDLGVTIVSTPKHVKACQTFQATFTVTNFGPDPASHINIMVFLPDPFSLVDLVGAPNSLAVGKTVTLSATIKVVGFVPGEPRSTWIGIDAVSDPYPDTSVDPNPDNNGIFKSIRMISKPVLSCP